MKEITVTELPRRLSEFINHANHRGESFVITRGSKAVAPIGPIPAGARVKDLRVIFDSLPAFDAKDLDMFAQDLAEVARGNERTGVRFVGRLIDTNVSIAAERARHPGPPRFAESNLARAARERCPHISDHCR